MEETEIKHQTAEVSMRSPGELNIILPGAGPARTDGRHFAVQVAVGLDVRAPNGAKCPVKSIAPLVQRRQRFPVTVSNRDVT